MNQERRVGRLSDDDLEREMKAALLRDAPDAVSDELRTAVGAVTSTVPVSTSPGRRFATLGGLTAAAAVVAAIAVTVGVLWSLRGGIAAPLPMATPTAPPTLATPTLPAVAPSSVPSATATELASTGLVAYTVVHCTQSTGSFHFPECASTPWVAGRDGSNARLLYDGASGAVLGWSADGSKLLLNGQAGLGVTD